MFRVTVDAGGPGGLVVPDAPPGSRIRVAVREDDADDWAVGSAWERFVPRVCPMRRCDAR